MSIVSINPATGELIERYEPFTSDKLHNVIASVASNQELWQQTSIEERRVLLAKTADAFEEVAADFAKTITSEVGKPLASAQLEVEKCALACRYYVDNIEKALSPKIMPTEMTKSAIHYEPLGIILGIMPWNFPIWQMVRFIIPAMMAGNGVVLKHAPNCTGSALLVEQLFNKIGFPKNLFRVLILEEAQVKQVIHDDRIHAVSLTGSPSAGSIVASQAGEALKKCVLELGGNDPAIILHDAELQSAAKATIASRMNNCGQVCIAVKRFITVPEIHDKFSQLIEQELENYRQGDPTLPQINLGPMAREDLRDNLHQQVTNSVAAGAQLLKGGVMPSGKGFFYPATILDNVTAGMPAYDEELFGPVIALIRADDEQDAIRIANDTPFGLGASVFTQDLTRGEHIASRCLQVGTACVNRTVSSDPRLPFGGIKRSGYGRELGLEGLYEFVNVKTVNML